MTVIELLPWLNLLLIPAVGLMLRVSNALTRLDTLQREHARRLDRIESDLIDLAGHTA